MKRHTSLSMRLDTNKHENANNTLYETLYKQTWKCTQHSLWDWVQTNMKMHTTLAPTKECLRVYAELEDLFPSVQTCTCLLHSAMLCPTLLALLDGHKFIWHWTQIGMTCIKWNTGEAAIKVWCISLCMFWICFYLAPRPVFVTIVAAVHTSFRNLSWVFICLGLMLLGLGKCWWITSVTMTTVIKKKFY